MASNAPARKVNAGQITEGIASVLDQVRFGQGAFAGSPSTIANIKISFKNLDGNSNALYEFDAFSSDLKIIAVAADEHDAIEVLDRAGLFPIEVEFSPASVETDKFVIRDDKVLGKETPETFPLRMSSEEEGFKQWIRKMCSLVDATVTIIPDTNFLRRQYYSHHLRQIAQEQLEIDFALSRLSEIEIENKYNTNSKNMKRLRKITSLNPEQQLALFRAGVERRVAFHVMNEVLAMKRDGFGTLMPVEMAKIKAFTDDSGDDLADPWIRSEILDYVANQREGANRTGTQFASGDKKVSKTCVFATADKMNALAATAANLNTLYVSRNEDKRQVTLVSQFGTPDYHRLSTLIVNVAIHFGECEVEIIAASGKSDKFKIIGDWSGKSTNDWVNERVLAGR